MFGWEWQYTPYIPLLWAAALSMTIIGLFAWRNRGATGARSFSVLMFASALWAVTYAFQIAGANEVTIGFWADVNHIPVTVAPVAWFWLSLQFTTYKRFATRRLLAVFVTIAIVYLTFVFTNSWHSLVRGPIEPTIVADGALVISEHSFGPVFWLHTAYSYLLILLGIGLFVQLLIWSPAVYRRQASLLILGGAVAVGTSAVYHTGLSPIPYVDITPFGFAITGIIFFIAIYQYQLFDLTPIARSFVIDRLEEGVVVLDPQYRIVDMNVAAQSLLLPPDATAIGERVDVLLPTAVCQSQFDGFVPMTTKDGSARSLGDERVRMTNEPPNMAESTQAVNKVERKNSVKAVLDSPETASETQHTALIAVEHDMETTYVQISTTPIVDARDDLVGYSMVLHDMTQTYQLQSELQRSAKKLQRSNEDLEAFAGAVSHDLRAPLRAIDWNLERLEDGIEHSSEQSELAKTAKENTEAAQEMIHALLSYAKVGGPETSFEHVDCNVVVNRVLSRLQFDIQNADATVKYEELPTVTGSSHLLELLFQNLLSNALTYSDETNPEIEISATTIRDGHKIHISDNGVGIDPDAIPYVFDIFYQVDPANTDGGTGMGLAICKKIVESHNGEITVDSTPGVGTTVTLYFPQNTEPFLSSQPQ